MAGDLVEVESGGWSERSDRAADAARERMGAARARWQSRSRESPSIGSSDAESLEGPARGERPEDAEAVGTQSGSGAEPKGVAVGPVDDGPDLDGDESEEEEPRSYGAGDQRRRRQGVGAGVADSAVDESQAISGLTHKLVATALRFAPLALGALGAVTTRELLEGAVRKGVPRSLRELGRAPGVGAFVGAAIASALPARGEAVRASTRNRSSLRAGS
jgi:hypothetical protein